MKDEVPRILETLLVEVQELRGEIRYLTGGILNCERAADYLGISARNLHELVRRGRIKRVTLSQNRFGFCREELERYAAEQEETYTDPTEAVVERLYSEATGE